MSKLRYLRHTLAPTAGLMLGTMSAFAADPAPATDKIVVIAVKQPYRGDTDLKDMPQSIRTLSADLLADVGVIKLDDALDLASSVARQNTFGGMWDSFAIRGFAGDENVPSGYLVNGFNAGRGFSGKRDASNIESIEVLKGPGSALYGRSEPGGTINLVTKKPRFTREGSVDFSVGSFSTYRFSGDYTGPINDAVAFRVNGAYENAKGFRDTGVKNEKTALSPSFLARLSQTTTLSYELEAVDQKGAFDRGVTAVNGKLGLIPQSRFLGEPADGPSHVKATGHQFVLQHELNDDWAILAGLGYRDSTFVGNQTNQRLLGGLQADGFTMNRERRYVDYATKDTVARAELTGKFSTGNFTNHVLLGVDADEFKYDKYQLRVRPGNLAYAINIFAPVYRTNLPAFTTVIFDSLETQRATGVYAQDQIDLTANWKALAGVRFDRFHQDILNRANNTTTKQDPTATSPRLGLVYEVSKTVTVYTSASTGFRPNSGANFANVAFEPEKSRSAEIGVKAESADHKLSGTVAAYKTRKTNITTADPVNAGYSIAAGEAESQGLEVDASGELMKDVRVAFSYAYTDAKITKNAVDVNGLGGAIHAGDPLLNIPKTSANLLLIHNFSSGGAAYDIGAGIGYVGSRLGETGFTSFRLPAYPLVKLIGSYSPSKKLKYTLEIENLLNKDYWPSSYGREWVAPGTPRAITAKALYKF
ncbi:MAG: TonB-dependent siderophore receptor [Proteobacteria bacterium]|nr:TonB-dependent siderophore receptor [Pseudomonadota bacterium]